MRDAGTPQHPVQRSVVACPGHDRGLDLERGPLARPDPQIELYPAAFNKLTGSSQQVAAVLAHEDTERLADEKALRDVQQLGRRAVGFENARVFGSDDVRVGRRIEQLPIPATLLFERDVTLGELRVLLDQVRVRDTKPADFESSSVSAAYLPFLMRCEA
jgi:hypothetical protein